MTSSSQQGDSTDGRLWDRVALIQSCGNYLCLLSVALPLLAPMAVLIYGKAIFNLPVSTHLLEWTVAGTMPAGLLLLLVAFTLLFHSDGLRREAFR